MSDRRSELSRGDNTIGADKLHLGVGALALVRNDAAACSLQRLVQPADNRPD
jgi:hypothetical protein